MTQVEIDINLQNTIIQFAKDFALKMNAIEKRIVELDKNNTDGTIDCFAVYKKEYNPVFQQYTTTKKRAYGGQANSFGEPTKYDGIEKNTVGQLNPKTKSRVEVVFKTDNSVKAEYLFVVLKKKEGWRIDNAKYKWNNALIWKSLYM
jgi:hypothetical protein